MSYRLLRPLLFILPPETAHRLGAGSLDAALRTRAVRERVRARLAVEDSRLRITRWGIPFPNPLGLAAGFDKAAAHVNVLGALGFGFVEVGTVTALAQPGNPPPRLFRLPRDRALLNRMGFNNPGAEAVAERLRNTPVEPILGINLGKSKATPLERATEDYLRSLELLEPYARFITVNVSSPNTPGLRTLQDATPLRGLLRALVSRARELARARGEEARPVLLKIAPDLSGAQLDEAVRIAAEEGVAGIIAANTTLSRAGLRTARIGAYGEGGISGAPLRARATAIIRRIHQSTGGALPIVGVGGVFDAEDAWAHIRAGASLVQTYTGFIYGGPGMVRGINRGLLERMERDGFRSLDEAVGSERG